MGLAFWPGILHSQNTTCSAEKAAQIQQHAQLEPQRRLQLQAEKRALQHEFEKLTEKGMQSSHHPLYDTL